MAIDDFFGLSNFPEKEQRMIVSQVGAIEISKGCSIGCKFCGFEAQKGVTTHISFAELEEFVRKFSVELQEKPGKFPFFYWASDPLDWEDGDKNYRDANELFESVLGFSPYVSTAVPVGKEALTLQLLQEGVVDRVSLSYMNLGRMKKALGSNLGDHEVLQTLKDMSTSAIDQTFLLTGSKAERGRIASLGEKNIDSLDSHGIGCYNGTLLRHSQPFNVAVVPVSRAHPQGIVYEELTPGSSVMEWESSDFYRCERIAYIFPDLPNESRDIQLSVRAAAALLPHAIISMSTHTFLNLEFVEALEKVHTYFEEKLDQSPSYTSFLEDPDVKYCRSKLRGKGYGELSKLVDDDITGWFEHVKEKGVQPLSNEERALLRRYHTAVLGICPEVREALYE